MYKVVSAKLFQFLNLSDVIMANVLSNRVRAVEVFCVQPVPGQRRQWRRANE